MDAEFPGKHPVTHPSGQYGLRASAGWVLALALSWAAHFAADAYMDPYVLGVLVYAGINTILAVSLNLINGFTGQFSMGHAGFMAIGAYASALLSTELGISSPLGFLAALLTGGCAASAAGWIVGLPSFRLKGDYLAIVTLGFGEIIRVLILNIDAVGGARGMTGIPPLSSLGWVASIAVTTVFVVWRLVNSSKGRALLAVREDEIAAQAMGVRTPRAKSIAFGIGAFFAGVAGGLFAHHLRYLGPQSFDFNRSFEIIIMVVLGGMGSITGSVLAALLLTLLREALRPLQELTRVDYRMVIYSGLLITLMLTRPNGLLGTRELTDWIKKIPGLGRKERARS